MIQVHADPADSPTGCPHRFSNYKYCAYCTDLYVPSNPVIRNGVIREDVQAVIARAKVRAKKTGTRLKKRMNGRSSKR